MKLCNISIFLGLSFLTYETEIIITRVVIVEKVFEKIKEHDEYKVPALCFSYSSC